MRPLVLLPVVLLAILLSSGCGAPTPPQCRILPRASAGPVEPRLAAAREAWAILADRSRRTAWPAAQERYNTAVSGLFDRLRCKQRSWTESAAALGTTIAVPADQQAGGEIVDPKIFQVIFPAREVDVARSGQRNAQAGVGVPAVGWIPESRARWQTLDFPPPTGAAAWLTVVLRCEPGRPAAWEFRRPFRTEELEIGRATHPLAADWTAAHAFYWNMSRMDELKLANVFIPDRVSDYEGLFMLHAYDPQRIPVVFVHGLKSSPDIYRRMINHLEGQRWFRERYQVWIYSYATGKPWPVTATHFSQQVAAIARFAEQRGGAATLRRMVVVGHSMGGLVAGLSLRNPGHRLYDLYFTRPPEALDLTESERDLVRRMLLYQPLPWPERVVFLAVPHRGSPLAERFFSTIAKALIRLPKTLTVELGDIVLQNLSAVAGGTGVPDHGAIERAAGVKLPTSIDYLDPRSRIFRAAPDLPFRPGLHVHSVIGDRGRGDSPDSSDGVVPYWSTHLDGVASEQIVPCDHNVPCNPQAIEEVERILHSHLGGTP
jgi:pimeloyl-ACP methyl ester carboxylesterase